MRSNLQIVLNGFAFLSLSWQSRLCRCFVNERCPNADFKMSGAASSHYACVRSKGSTTYGAAHFAISIWTSLIHKVAAKQQLPSGQDEGRKGKTFHIR